MASKGCQLADVSRPLLRAQAIPDAEWETRRARLVELYLETNASRKEVVDTMARDNFTITETQLKRRFQLWGVRKYIPQQDMTAILSVKTQHDVAGKQVRIQYKDHDIDHERIERAFKRRKGPLNAPRNPTDTPFFNHQITSSYAGTGELKSTAAEDVQNGGSSQPANYGDSHQPHISFEDDFDDQIATQPSSTWVPDFELPNFPNSLPDGRASYGAPDLHFGFSSLPDPLNSFPFDLTASPLPKSGSHGSLQEIAREDSLLRSRERADIKVLDPFVFEGSNPEEIVLPLHLLKTSFPVHWARGSLGEYVGSADPFANLFHFINSMQLPLEIEDLLCQCFELSARSIRERQAVKTGRGTGVTHCAPSPEASTQRSRPHYNLRFGHDNQIVQDVERKVTHHLMWAVSKGVIKLRLTFRAERSNFGSESKKQSILSVSFMPGDDKRTTGITISFRDAQHARPGTTLSRRIKTINVVPKDSEVIQYVSHNDLRSLQMLFDKREASPLDVDPQGFSLLSYAMYNGCSEVYLLLLQGGAGTQDCDRFGTTVDIVWAIWSTFADYNSQMLPASYYLPNVVRDFDQVASMTDAALRYGCDIEDVTGWTPRVANALFEIVRWCSLKEPHLSVPEKAIKYLVKVGYDLERRNHEGLTPLLDAATNYPPQVIQCLNTYIKIGADINAVDASGRGALHGALAVPHCFEHWNTLRLKNKIMFDILSYYYVPMCVFDTEDDEFAGDYEDVGLDPKPLEQKLLAERSIRRGKVCLGKCQSSRMHRVKSDTNSTRMTFDWTVSSDACECGIDFDGYAAELTAYGDPHVPDGSAYEYIFCKDFAGAEHFIRHPIKVLKTRLRFKLLTLLRANCDPNVLDNAGASPSDYARRDGLWPQWHWALKNTGFSYEPGSDRWSRIKTPHLLAAPPKRNAHSPTSSISHISPPQDPPSPPKENANMFRTPYYEGWESDIIWQLADLFEAAIGAPKILDARRALARYPPVQIIYATPRYSQCRDLVDWSSVRPELMHLFENHGNVYFEFGGHDEFRNIWFHCLRIETDFEASQEADCKVQGEWVWNRGMAFGFRFAVRNESGNGNGDNETQFTEQANFLRDSNQ
ncbi:MAG: hypothetical protein ASARMPREDX12_006868 [Alectoria sarmentosa]|nr:MAG: hypothetical protein ASARMPREDX12_006868 [Alectoria sarmentosa]